VVARAPLPGGFTLIELMVTLAIMAMLLLAAAPFTLDWADGTRQMRARSNLLEGVGQARALAMRDPYRCGPAGGAVAKLAYAADTQTLRVFMRARAGGECAAGWEDAPVWQGRITSSGGLALHAVATPSCPASTQLPPVPAGSPAFSCAAYDSRGRQVAESGCASQDQTCVAIAVGRQEPVYVDLL